MNQLEHLKINRISDSLDLLIDNPSHKVTIFNRGQSSLAIQLINDRDERLFEVNKSYSEKILINLDQWPIGTCYLNISSETESYSKKILFH